MVRVGLGHFMLGAGLVLASPVLLGAQSSCLADSKGQKAWQAPLDRLVTLRDQSLPRIGCEGWSQARWCTSGGDDCEKDGCYPHVMISRGES